MAVSQSDKAFMRTAFEEALKDVPLRIYPVGALVVMDGKIISRAHNGCGAAHDPTAHAEITAIRLACATLQSGSLAGAVLYTSLFPCPMCEAAIIEAKITRVCYGARAWAWIREVKFAPGQLACDGPLMQAACGGLFEDELRRRNRRDILDYTAHEPE